MARSAVSASSVPSSSGRIVTVTLELTSNGERVGATQERFGSPCGQLESRGKSGARGLRVVEAERRVQCP